MPISNLLPIDKNPASIVIGTMPEVARPYNFDVEIFVKGLDSGVQKFHYYVNEVDKPKFDFQYDEINQYGYRYNILTGIRFGEVNMTILDDADNKSLSFLIAYLNGVMGESADNPSILSSLVGGQPEQPDTRFTNSKILPSLESNPEQANVKALGNESGTGVIIQEIKLHQYVSHNLAGTANGRIRTWTFADPQIVNMDMSQFSTENDEIGSFNFSFNFKNVSIELDTKEYPDTPFELLRAATIADTAVGAATADKATLIKAVTNTGAKLATDTLNGSLPGVSGSSVVGAGLALGKTVKDTKKQTEATIAKIPHKSQDERSKNGYVIPPSPPIKPRQVPKATPPPAAQQSKLDKING